MITSLRNFFSFIPCSFLILDKEEAGVFLRTECELYIFKMCVKAEVFRKLRVMMSSVECVVQCTNL